MVALRTLYEFLPDLLAGALLSLQIVTIAACIGFCGGLLLALVQLYGNRLLRLCVQLYLLIIRGTPMLVQIVAVFFMLPYIGVSLPAFWSAVVAIGLHSAAYMSQIIRSGIQAVGIGQQEAAYTLGFSRWQTMRLIVLPQAFRLILPALGNEFIALIKDSSLASVIGVAELTHQGSFMMSRTYDALTTYLAVGCIYLCIISALTLGLHVAERRSPYAQH